MTNINYTPSESAYVGGKSIQSAAASATTTGTNINKPDGASAADIKSAKAEDDGLSFADFIDIINPLQHIPVVSSIYRAITNDDISPIARFVGSSLYLGPIGAASALANIAVEEATGKDLGEQVASLLDGDETGTNDPNGQTLEIEAIIAEHNIEQDELAQQAMLARDNAAQPQLVEGGAFTGTALDPSAAFTFNQSNTNTSNTVAALAPSRAADPINTYASGFNSNPQPIALESLPADILAALYSGAPLSPAGVMNTGVMDPAAAVNAYARGATAGAVSSESPQVSQRWNLWQQVDDPATSTPAEMVTQALFPRALDSYQSSRNLINPAGQFVNRVE